MQMALVDRRGEPGRPSNELPTALSGSQAEASESLRNGVVRLLPSDVLAVTLLFGIAALRWYVASSFAEPSGLDEGNWLAYGRSIFGSHSRSASLAYPPLVPVLMLAITQLVGPFRGAELLGAVSSIMPGAGLYVLLRHRLRLRAALLAALLALSATMGEAEAW